jgi:hypothetical protein
MKYPDWIHNILDPTSYASRERVPRGVGDPGPWPTTPQDLEISGTIGWDEATAKQAKPRTKAQIQKRLKHDNYWRWLRLRHDIKWMKKRLEKMGLNPEDWRSYLDG